MNSLEGVEKFREMDHFEEVACPEECEGQFSSSFQFSDKFRNNLGIAEVIEGGREFTYFNPEVSNM